MKLLPVSIALSLVGVGTAVADSPTNTALPKVGDMLGENPAPWPKMEWLYDGPSSNEAAGKVVVHWFCAPKIVACTEDLARLTALRDHGKVYIVAHISGTKKDALKLDPIQGSEGVGRGTVGYGKGVTAVMKTMGITGPTSFVINTDGKITTVIDSSSATELELRDRKATALANAIKEYVTVAEGVKLVKAGEKFTLSMTVKLAGWLKYSKKQPMEFKLTAPPDIKCDSMTLTGDQLKIDVDNRLLAQVSCSGAKGSYELRGELRFGYDTMTGGVGLGQDGASWKLDIRAEGGLGGK